MPFEIQRLEIPEVVLIKPRVFSDDRGFFVETYKKFDFIDYDIDLDFVQDNLSCSSRGTLRGLHYQMNPSPQGKLVMVVSGSMLDVAVDIRRGSPTYGKWVSADLSASNKHMLWIPPGFAHGFVALEDDTKLYYKNTDIYVPELAREILWNDPDIGINWPISDPILSPKDTKAPLLKDADNNYKYHGG